MMLFVESKKLKRTGFIAAFLGGGILASLIPILNMAVRSENFVGLSERPLKILLDANWQMMAMLNVLLVVIGACMMYYTEYADNAMQKMRTLSMKESTMFFGKFILLVGMSAVVLALEAATVSFCTVHWFSADTDFFIELLKNYGYTLLLIVPSAAFSLVIASACKNMWVSLGICVVCIFTATMISNKNFILSLFPFALPFQTFSEDAVKYCIAACIEMIVAGATELIYLKGRRAFE
ncbi:MAG: ABC transporter permease [Lachnospiraceae bacterium]|nr:ABC transporter permease [Lachnospiraceae bacterium]